MYYPTVVDIQWAKEQMRSLNNGGSLVLKKAKLVYRVEHDKRRLVLTNVDQLRDSYSSGIHEANLATFQRIGYSIIKQQAPTKTETLTADLLRQDDEDPRRS